MLIAENLRQLVFMHFVAAALWLPVALIGQFSSALIG